MEEHTVPFHPVEIQLGASAYFTTVGGRLEIPFALVNRTGREDYFEVNVHGIPAGWAMLDIPVIHLSPDERRESSLVIHAPADSAGSYSVTVEVASQADASVAGEASFDLRISPVNQGSDYDSVATLRSAEDTRRAAGSSAPGRIDVRLDSLQYSVIPGSSTAVQVSVSNQGMHEDTFYLALEGLPPSWVSATETTFHLLPGERREAIFYIQPPLSPNSRAGRHPFTMRAGSQSEPGYSAVLDAALTVAAFSQFIGDLSPRRMDAGHTARLRILNQGNIQSSYTISWQSRGIDLDFVPSTPGPVTVMPGEAAVMEVDVSPRSPNWLGSPNMIPYTAVVTSSEGEAQAFNGEIISRALIPVWVLPAMLVLCLTAICGVGFLWNWNQNRLAYATSTAEAAANLWVAATETAVYNQTAAALAGQEDSDGDGLTNTQEAELGTNPQAADSDGDRIIDGDEVLAGLDPRNPDTDGDGTLDGLDIDPLDPNNPSLTATAAVLAGDQATAAALTATALVPIPTNTLPSTPTLTFTPVPPANTPVPPTNTPLPLTPTPTSTNPPPTPTATQVALPVTGEQFILFASNREGSTDLYLFSAQESELARLTDSGGEDTQPGWSPDGDRIAFTSSRDGNNEIYVMNADGSGLANLTNHPADDSYPRWTADGQFILFHSNRDGNYEVYIMQADGAEPANLTNHPANDVQPAWYATGGLLGGEERILFTSDRDGNNEIYAMNADGSAAANLTQNPASDTLPAARAGVEDILFVTDRDGNNEVYRMDLDGVGAANLTQNPANDTLPEWSPDGENILFVTDRDGNLEVYVMQPDGSEQANLSSSPAEDLDPAWR